MLEGFCSHAFRLHRFTARFLTDSIRVWLGLHPAHPGHGHSRPTGLGAVALVEQYAETRSDGMS
jgi:hypothetical protein